MRYLDLVVLVVVALPIFLLADLPIAAYVVGGGAWIFQRIAQALMQRRAEASDDPRVVAGWTAGSMIVRGWACALAIFAVGVAEGDEAGLSAALLVIGLFTVYFLVRMILRPFGGGAMTTATAPKPSGGGLSRRTKVFIGIAVWIGDRNPALRTARR